MDSSRARPPRRRALVSLLTLALLGVLVVLCQYEILLAQPRRGGTTKHTLTITALRATREIKSASSSSSSLRAAFPNESTDSLLVLDTPHVTSSQSDALPPFRRFRTDYVCVGWHATRDCSPDSERDPIHDADCDASIHGGRAGFCLYRHKHLNETTRVMTMHCDSLATHVTFDCAYAAQLVDYSAVSLRYHHDSNDGLTVDASQQHDPTETAMAETVVSFERGIAFVVYGDVLASAYASIRLLRELGTTLPIEVWFKSVEVASDHALLVELVNHCGVIRREIRDPFATDYYTKLYAVFYSAFDHVLLLDADNFAVRDPTYLFTTPEFTSTGAVFWPDFWHPNSTIFHVTAHSVLWQVLDLPFVDMFEQESGQLLIDRRRHAKALHLLMYYGFALPRVHEELVWGDKDLFRLAWLKTQSSFHMITTPPASAGVLQQATNTFCGLTMVQHDPLGEILFLHRNLVKLRVDTLPARIWTHVLQFKRGRPRAKYVIQWSKVYADIESCWGRREPVDMLDDFTVTPVRAFAFRDIEVRLVELMNEAGTVMYSDDRQRNTTH